MQVTLSAFFMVLTLSPLLSPAEAGSSRFIEAGKREPLRQKGYIDFCEDHPKEECDKKKTIVPPLPLEENNISKKVFLQELTNVNPPAMYCIV